MSRRVTRPGRRNWDDIRIGGGNCACCKPPRMPRDWDPSVSLMRKQVAKVFEVLRALSSGA